MIASSGEYIDTNDWYEALWEALVSEVFIDGCGVAIEKCSDELVLVVRDGFDEDSQWVNFERQDIPTLIGMLQRTESILAERDNKHV